MYKLRKTIIFEHVMKILNKSIHALSISQIMQELQNNNLTPNKTTLYRLLHKLERDSKVYGITRNNGVTYYEVKKKHRHHHFFCNSCEAVYCLDECQLITNNINLKQLLPNNNFQITNHDFNLYGTCSTCSTYS